MSAVYDPWEESAHATAPTNAFYGQISLDMWPCVLIKGQGKVPFDPTRDPEDNRRTAVDIAITPLAGSRAQFSIVRSIIAQSPEWYKHIWPSLKALGLTNPKQAVGKWCKLERVPTGKTYRSNRDGVERDELVIKFLALYDTEDECRAAYEADTGQPASASDDDEPIPGFEDVRTNAAPAEDPQRKMAISFLQAIAKQHKGDMDAIKRAVGNVSLITLHFDPESDEFRNIVAEALA